MMSQVWPLLFLAPWFINSSITHFSHSLLQISAKPLVEKKVMVPSWIANQVQTSGCATATTAITFECVYNKYLAIQKCWVALETLILFRARNWSYFECLMIQWPLEKETNTHRLTVASLNIREQEEIRSCAGEDRSKKLEEGHRWFLWDRES